MLKARQELDNAQKQILTVSNKITTSTDSKLESDAQQIYLKKKIEAKTAELNMLDAENASYSVRLALLKEQLQLLSLQKNAFTPLISTIESVLNDLKLQEDRNRLDALTHAEQELASKPKPIQEIMKENIEYSQKLQLINDKISNYEKEELTRNQRSINKRVKRCF
jgi:hypothetical protein